MTIKMYGLSTCPHCKSALKLLEGASTDYEVIWLDELEGDERKRALETIYNTTGNYSVPLCIKGNTWVSGFKREELEELAQ